MSSLDHRIIIELQNDPRQSNKRLANSLGIAEATVRRRIDNLISSENLILTALPNLKMFGFPTHVFIILRSERSKFDEVSAQLFRIPNLRFISHCVGGADFFIRGDFPSVDALSDFIVNELGKIPGISKIETMLEYKQFKRTHDRLGISQLTKTSAPHTNIVITESDHQLIRQLQKNARATLKEIATHVGVSEATIHRRIKELVKSGAIEFTAIPDETRDTHILHTIISLRIELALIPQVAEAITQYAQVNYIGLVSGPNQLLVGMHAESTEDLLTFVTQEISKINGIISLESLTLLKVIKQKYTWLNE
jgi:DNA-binding Lrp family transcriptional regulator